MQDAPPAPQRAGTYFVQSPALSASMVAIRAQIPCVSRGLNARNGTATALLKSSRCVSRSRAPESWTLKVGRFGESTGARWRSDRVPSPPDEPSSPESPDSARLAGCRPHLCGLRLFQNRPSLFESIAIPFVQVRRVGPASFRGQPQSPPADPAGNLAPEGGSSGVSVFGRARRSEGRGGVEVGGRS